MKRIRKTLVMLAYAGKYVLEDLLLGGAAEKARITERAKLNELTLNGRVFRYEGDLGKTVIVPSAWLDGSDEYPTH